MVASVPASPEPGSRAQGVDYLSKGRTDLLNKFLASPLPTEDKIQIQRSPCLITQFSFCWPGFRRKPLCEKETKCFGCILGWKEEGESGGRMAGRKGREIVKNKKETRDQQCPLGHGGPML